MSIQTAISRFLIHPAFLSLGVTILIVLFFIPKQNKHILKIEDERYLINTSVVLYDDLDGNGYSDRINVSFYAQSYNLTSLQVLCNPSQSFNEWEFKGSSFFNNRGILKTGDYNNDGKKEIYFFTISSDSAFLNIIKDPESKKSISKSRFITTFKPFNGQPQLRVFINDLVDMNQDSYKDLVFSINSGFSIEPRNVYIYDIKNDSLNVSPKKGYFGEPTVIKDINGDGYNEIILNGYAIQNVKDTVATPIHDICCWLLVYDHNLKYLFPPRRFPDFGYSELTTVVLPGNTGKYKMLGWYRPPESSDKSMNLYVFNQEGSVIKSLSVPRITFKNLVKGITFRRGKDNYLGIAYSYQEISCYDTSLGLAFKIPISKGMFYDPDTLDVDDDGSKEVFSVDGTRNLFTVFRSDLSDPVSVKLPQYTWDNSLVSVIKKPGLNPLMAIFNGEYELQLSYGKNLFYYTRWLVYLAIFLAVYLFALFIRRIQRIQILKQQQTEKKITELQMKVVRNQMDPHFTMNAVNSVIAAIHQNEKEQAAQHLLHFSSMYRHLVLTADKITCSLAEEIGFTRDYLTMEQFRFRDKFTFEIDISPEVNLNLEVPKMVIQSPVENAIKHGLLNLLGKGNLNISAKNIDNQLILNITDNGIGRKAAVESGSQSTSKGMKAMEEFLRLYQKVTGCKVETDVTDLSDSYGNPLGTKVVVKIQIS